MFAIAITLLVLEIRLPDEHRIEELGGLAKALLGLWPSYAGYVISFVTIGIMASGTTWLPPTGPPTPPSGTIS